MKDLFKKRQPPAKLIRQFYKRFANGEQYIEFERSNNKFVIVSQVPQFYWQQQKVFNHVKPLIDLYGKEYTEEELYGRYGLVSLLEPYQREYNKIMNSHSEHISKATYAFMTVEDGSVDTDELNNEVLPMNEIVVYRQGCREPELKTTTLATEDYLKSADYCLRKMGQIVVNFIEAHKKENNNDRISQNRDFI